MLHQIFLEVNILYIKTLKQKPRPSVSSYLSHIQMVVVHGESEALVTSVQKIIRYL